MASALAFALTAGSFLGSKALHAWNRRTVFCVSHLTIGSLLCLAGYFVSIHCGIAAFVCIFFCQMWLQILTAPLFVYQTEVLQNNALGMVNAWRTLLFTFVKVFVDNVFTSLDPVFYVMIGRFFYFFGIVQLIAFGIIYHMLDETKGKTRAEKRITTNPIKWEQLQNNQMKFDENFEKLEESESAALKRYQKEKGIVRSIDDLVAK
jgi:hypothetical protein